jgi:hypothetical protein
MALPSAQDVYDFLDGYGIDSSLISDTWIENRRDNLIIPWIENHTRLNFSEETEYTEYLSGNGKSILILSRRPINELISLEYVGVADGSLSTIIEIDYNSGILILKANLQEGIFNNNFQKGEKNIKVVYKAGYNDFLDPRTNKVANDVKEAIIMMLAKNVLIIIGSRTGGGALSVQSHSRNYGARGKYTDIINNLDMMAYEILKCYSTGVIG